MGIRKNIDYDTFPKQGNVGKRVRVCFRAVECMYSYDMGIKQ